MIAHWLLCAVALLSAEPGSKAQKMGDESFLRRAEAAMSEDVEFFAWHRGFLAYLDERPELLAAEQAWWDVLIEPTVGGAARAFDEALLGDATAMAGLDTFYDLIARDPELRAQTEALQRVEFTERDGRAMVAPALEALRADPDLALRLLNGEMDTGGLAQPLQAFARYLAQRPGLVQELGDAFGVIGAAPLAQTRLLPWWQQLAQGNGVAGAYAGLAAPFAQAPRRFWAWHARELAWAEDAQARAWMRFVYRRARRVPGLDDAYVHYLRALYVRDGARMAAEQRYKTMAEGVVRFPPLPAPPVLAPSIVRAPTEDDARLTPRAPVRPTRPDAPARPTMPERPKLEMRKAAPRSAAPDQAGPGRGRRSEESR